MKKLTSILCALVIALGAIAAPQLRAEKVASLSKAEKIEKKAAKQAFVGIKAVKEAKAEKVAFKQIRKAKAAATNVTINAVEAEYYEDYSEFTYELAGANGYYYIFGFASTGADPVVAGTTYTLDDMVEAYLYRAYYDWPDFTACTFKKTIVDGKVKIEATATDEEGGEWILSYDESAIPELPEGGTFVADQIVADSYSSDIWYKLTATDARLTFYFDIKLSTGADDIESGKEYTLDDMLANYTYIVFNQTTKILITSASFTKTVAEDGSYTIAATMVDENSHTWTISGAKAAPQVTEKVVELPEGAEVVEYSMSFTDYDNAAASKPVNVAVVGNQVYFQGMSDALPEAWAVGTKEGNTITFAAGQFMGEYGSYGDVIFPYTSTVFTFDAEANTYSATGTVFGAVGNYYDGYYTNPVLSLVVETAATPANPAITALKNGNYGYYIVFSVPTVDVEGNGLLSSKLSFQFFTDIEHDIQPLVFTPATHTYLTEDMTIIPFGFTEDWDFYSTQIYLNELYSADWNKLGIKSIYTGGGETNETEIQWFDIKEYAPATSIDNTNAAAKAVKRIENGQIVIEKNGVRYNVLGAEMK